MFCGNISNCNLNRKNISKTPSSEPSKLNLLKRPVNADSGTTGHYLSFDDKAVLSNLQPASKPISVKLPNGKIIASTHTGMLNLPLLPIAARLAHVFPQLTGSLLSIGQLCDSGYKAVFDSTTVSINDTSGRSVLVGYRDQETRLYMINLDSAEYHSTAAIDPGNTTSVVADGAASESLYITRNQAETVQFFHACLGSPADSTYIAAATKGYLDSFPGLTAAIIRKYPPNSLASAKGHLDRIRQGIRSTKHISPIETNESTTDWHPEPQTKKIVTAEVYVKIFRTGELHHDNTGQFPVKSTSGNSYVAVSYCEDANYIHVEPLQSNSAADAIQCHHNIIAFYRGCNIEPTFLRLDNQTSIELETYFKNVAKVQFQYVAPHNHRVNKAERAIRTWKNHFISTLATADPTFPLNLWDKLLLQSEMTLNLLRSSKCTPHISAYHQLHGKYDYSKNPIGPLGCKVVAFDPPSVRLTYGAHGEEGFNIGPAMKHYRCFDVWITKTKHTRIVDTLSWHPPSPLIMPTHTPYDELINAVYTLTNSLTSYANTLPSLKHKESLPIEINNIHSAVKLLHKIFSHPTTSSPPDSNQRVDINPDEQPSNVVTIVSGTENNSNQSLPNISNNSNISNSENSSSNSDNGSSNSDNSSSNSDNNSSNSDDIASNEDNRSSNSEDSSSSSDSNNTNRTIVNNSKSDKNESEFNAEKIVAHRGNLSSTSKPLRFKVRWLGFKHTDDTWEPITNVQHCKAFYDYVDSRPNLWHLHAPNDPTFPTINNSINSSSRCEAKLTDVSAINIAAAMMAIDISNFNNDQTRYNNESSYNSCSLGSACAAGSIDSEGNVLKYRKCIQGIDKENWLQAAHEEIVRLVSVRNTMHFIKKSQIPKDRLASYYNPRCNRKWKNGVNIFRVRGTYGGNISDYSGETAAYTADMATVKILLNKTVSDISKRWMTADITDMYLHTTDMERPEYMFIDLVNIPQQTFDHFNLSQFIKDGDKSVAVEVTGGMYGLPQAGILAQQQLITHLEKHGYKQCKNTVCLFRHESKNIEFSLIVDDFGISYDSKESAEHLLSILREKYPITVDYEGKKYAGFDITFDYGTKSRKVELAMKGYVAAALKRFNISSTTNTYSPEYFHPINYGSKDSQLTNDDNSPKLADTDKKWIQEVVGVMLFYARGVDGTMMTSVNRISSQQANATENTKAAAIRLLQYAATFPDATLVYYPSDMILYIDADASYNSESEARSRAGVFFYLGKATDPNLEFTNGPIDCISTIIPTVVSAASEAEYATCFIAGKQGLCYRYTLNDIDCIQPITQIITDNKTAKGIATKTCKQKRSKAIDMRYHWIRDRVALKDFNIVWRAGKHSIADYLTKPHPVPHTLHMRKYFVKQTMPTFTTTKARREQIRVS